MSKAENRYLDLFLDGRLRNCSRKDAFLLGYHQAEKDLKLTWEDIVEIDKLLIDLGMMFPIKSTPDYYDEVLKRFKERKQQ